MVLKRSRPGILDQAKRRTTATALGISLALPLFSSISGCEIFYKDNCAPEKSECRQYNSTTVTVNRKNIDGKVAGIETLFQTHGFLSEPLADAINETHAISSAGLPENTRLTHPEDYCFSNRVNGVAPAAGYAVPLSFEESCDGKWESGVYLAAPELAAGDLYVVNHEIGHLQHPNGGEIGAELNALEQTALLAKILLDQGLDADAISWINFSSWNYFGLTNLTAAAGYFNSEKETTETVGDCPFYKHVRSDIFLIEYLTENQHGIPELRESTNDLFFEAMFNEGSQKRLDEFSRRYSERKWGDVILDMVLRTKAILFRYFNSRFGEGEAMRFFRANNRLFLPVQKYKPGVVVGLEDLNCVSLSKPDQDSAGSCYFSESFEEKCTLWQSTTYRWLIGIKLRCFSVSIENEIPAFQGWDIDADARFYHAGGAMLNVDGLETQAVYEFYNFNSRVPLEDPY